MSMSVGALNAEIISLDGVQPNSELRLIIKPGGVVWDFYVLNDLFVNLVRV